MSDDDRSAAAELMTQRAEQVSAQMQNLLHGIGEATQGAVLADLVSLWLAGHFEHSELGLPAEAERPLTAQMRGEILAQWLTLVRTLVPVSEQQVLARAQAEGHG